MDQRVGRSRMLPYESANTRETTWLRVSWALNLPATKLRLLLLPTAGKSCPASSPLRLHVHRKYGGVVPELASREHLRSIVPVVREALERAGMKLKRAGCCRSHIRTRFGRLVAGGFDVRQSGGKCAREATHRRQSPGRSRSSGVPGGVSFGPRSRLCRRFALSFPADIRCCTKSGTAVPPEF